MLHEQRRSHCSEHTEKDTIGPQDPRALGLEENIYFPSEKSARQLFSGQIVLLKGPLLYHVHFQAPGENLV